MILLRYWENLCLYMMLSGCNTAGRSGLAVTCLTAVWEDQGSNPTVGSCVFIVKPTTIYSLWHRLRTLTAVPRSTQPSALCGMVKWVLAFGLSNNNKWRWWVWLLAAYRRTHSPGRLAWSEGRRPFHIHHMNRVNSHSGLSYDDSTMNVISLILVVIIINTVTCFCVISPGRVEVKFSQHSWGSAVSDWAKWVSVWVGG